MTRLTGGGEGRREEWGRRSHTSAAAEHGQVARGYLPEGRAEAAHCGAVGGADGDGFSRSLVEANG